MSADPRLYSPLRPRYRVLAYVCESGRVTRPADEGFVEVIHIHAVRPVWCRFLVLQQVDGQIVGVDVYHDNNTQNHNLHVFESSCMKQFDDLDTAIATYVMGYDMFSATDP